MIEELSHITIAASSIQKSLNFYYEILSFVGHIK